MGKGCRCLPLSKGMGTGPVPQQGCASLCLQASCCLGLSCCLCSVLSAIRPFTMPGMLLCTSGPEATDSCPCAALATALRRDVVALELRTVTLRRAQGGRFCPPRLKATLPQAGVFPFEKLMAPIPVFRPALARRPLLTSVPGYCQNAIKPKGNCISCLGL